jgi:hypothetical protein
MWEGVLHHTSRSPGQDMPAGGSWHMVWGGRSGRHPSCAGGSGSDHLSALSRARAGRFRCVNSTFCGGEACAARWRSRSRYRCQYSCRSIMTSSSPPSGDVLCRRARPHDADADEAAKRFCKECEIGTNSTEHIDSDPVFAACKSDPFFHCPVGTSPDPKSCDGFNN